MLYNNQGFVLSRFRHPFHPSDVGLICRNLIKIIIDWCHFASLLDMCSHLGKIFVDLTVDFCGSNLTIILRLYLSILSLVVHLWITSVDSFWTSCAHHIDHRRYLTQFLILWCWFRVNWGHSSTWVCQSILNSLDFGSIESCKIRWRAFSIIFLQ